ncbi:glycosyltransferase family 4 protein [Longimicrobium sp.]|uniref:glycosyltransferase family 4 protein n=1 Tax=Longimicrobium sp. TaxID=2029185 RepID=UPI002E2F4FC5|nr:glycosyltransferase family 4 protein [Longimicrobium sp.]HEX6041334.1 glycosyltransferase family 4 protein [Longimicrobium sp.]
MSAGGLRVLVVVFHWSRGGGLEAVGWEIARGLGALGAAVEVWSVAQAGPQEVDGAAARGLAPQRGGRVARSLDARGLWRVRLAREAARGAHRFDLVIAAHPWLLPPLRHGLDGRPGRPACWAWAHGIEVWGQAGARIARDLAWADRVVAVSRFTRDQVSPWVRPERLALVHNPVDTEFYTPGAPAAPGADLLVVGRLARAERYKGHDVLLRALGPLEARLGRPVTLRVVGDGDWRPDLEREAAALGVADRVEFAGRVPFPALLDAYRGCGVFAMPSRVDRPRRGLWTGEGLGIVYLEAQACGRPVVASTEGGAPDAVAPGETGVLADPRDPAAVARAAAELLADPARAAEMGARGRRWVEEHFSLPRFRARLAALLPGA